MIGMYINDYSYMLEQNLNYLLNSIELWAYCLSSWILHLTLYLPEVISKYFLPIVSIHYPANR